MPQGLPGAAPMFSVLKHVAELGDVFTPLNSLPIMWRAAIATLYSMGYLEENRDPKNQAGAAFRVSNNGRALLAATRNTALRHEP